MEEQEPDTKKNSFDTLEHADTAESFRQLWWTIGVTVVGLALIAYVYL